MVLADQQGPAALENPAGLRVGTASDPPPTRPRGRRCTPHRNARRPRPANRPRRPARSGRPSRVRPPSPRRYRAALGRCRRFGASPDTVTVSSRGADDHLHVDRHREVRRQREPVADDGGEAREGERQLVGAGAQIDYPVPAPAVGDSDAAALDEGRAPRLHSHAGQRPARVVRDPTRHPGSGRAPPRESTRRAERQEPVRRRGSSPNPAPLSIAFAWREPCGLGIVPSCLKPVAPTALPISQMGDARHLCLLLFCRACGRSAKRRRRRWPATGAAMSTRTGNRAHPRRTAPRGAGFLSGRCSDSARRRSRRRATRRRTGRASSRGVGSRPGSARGAATRPPPVRPRAAASQSAPGPGSR